MKQRFAIVKLTICPQLMYRFNVSPVIISTAILDEIDKLILKYIWKFKGPRVAKIILKKNKCEGFTFPQF